MKRKVYIIPKETEIIDLYVKELDQVDIYYLGTIEEYLQTIKTGNIEDVPCIKCKDGLHIQKL